MAEATETSTTTSINASEPEQQNESYVAKTMKFFYGHIFGTAPSEEPTVVEEESEGESTDEESEEEEEVFEQDHRSQLVTAEDIEDDMKAAVVKVPDSKAKEDALKDVCKFFVKGQCKFGDNCFFAHPQELAAKPADLSPKSRKRAAKAESRRARKAAEDVEAKGSKKKVSMKTAMDVIKRIQWDESLPGEYFTVGYLDRFTGVEEEPFERFSNWGDLANAEIDALAVPQHRIQYFKYRGEKVWDKAARLDLVFGSVDRRAERIDQLMDRVDERVRNEKKPATVNEAETSSSSWNSDDDSDSDDDDMAINIGKVDATPASYVSSIPEEERSTHFLALQVTNNAVLENARRVQDHMVAAEPELAECCMKPGLFHVTLGMLRLSGQAGADEASAIVDSMRPALEAANGTKIRVAGLETFGQRVLYAKVEPEDNDTFWTFVGELKDRISKSSAAVNVTDKFDLTPHMTLVKVNRPISRLRKSKYLPSALYERFSDLDFGVQKLDNLQLCVIEASTRFDGFYRTINDLRM